MKALIFGLVCVALAVCLGGYHFVWKPTPDQLYGCTVKQQMPNGDCP